MNIYASNLSYNTGDVELSELFSAYGEVTSAKVITDRETGRSRGFGFVEMSSEEHGNAAIAGLNDKEVEGRAMSVSVAKEKQSGSRSTYNGNSRGNYGNKW
jgi:RNA recognition motif-containing protein